MTLFHLPWVELAILVALLGALCVSQVRVPERAARWGLLFTGSAFVCAFLAWLGFYLGVPPGASDAWSLQVRALGRPVLGLDELNAPLVPAVALLHFLTGLATSRANVRRFSFTWSLAAEAIRLATFSARDPWVLVCLLIVGTFPPYVELVNRKRPTRVYVLHMGLFVALLATGAFLARAAAVGAVPSTWAAGALLLAILVRCGTIPVHCWVTDWFEHASLGIALLFVVPLGGVYAAFRLVLPIAPDWMLQGLSVVSLLTAVYAAAMAIVQRDARRFFAYLFLSHSSLVLVGLELHTPLSLTGGLCLWFAVILSLGGFGLTLRAVEARYGRLSLADFHGLYEHSPTLAVCFLLTGLASVGFPGTLGFISSELLVDGAIEVNPYVGVAVVAAAALNGIAVVRAYLLLFTGTRHYSTVLLKTGVRERLAYLTLAALILGGGLFPQLGVASRWRAAVALQKERESRAGLLGGPDQEARGPAVVPDLGVEEDDSPR
jgi:NADH-quinone oxidoreductase subunit M